MSRLSLRSPASGCSRRQASRTPSPSESYTRNDGDRDRLVGRRGRRATLDLTERAGRAAGTVRCRTSARLVADDAHLADIVARLTACGVDDVFVPAGDADPAEVKPVRQRPVAAGTARGDGNPFARIGITGYPETHPRIE